MEAVPLPLPVYDRAITSKSDLDMTTEEIHDFLRERDGDRCFTGDHEWRIGDEITIEHWYPLVHGGTWNIENLRLACKHHNAWKGDRIPNVDGTIPPHPKDLLPVHQRRADKSGRVDLCETCESGRLLSYGDVCDVCGSGPQPQTFPKYAQRQPKDCNHHDTHCWWCVVEEPELRTRAYEDVFGVES